MVLIAAVVSGRTRVLKQLFHQLFILFGIRIAFLVLELNLFFQVVHSLFKGLCFGLVECEIVLAETHADCVLLQFAHFGSESLLVGREMCWVCGRY
jgi:hypothetical protein